MNIVLRRSKKVDWQTLKKIHLELYSNSFQFDKYMDPNDPHSPKSTKEFKDDVSNPDKFCVFAMLDGEAIGYLVGGENNYSWRTNRRGEIYHMAVSPVHRSHGVGTILVNEFKKWCLGKGLTHIAATAYFADAKARAFYERQGMVSIDTTLEGPIK